MPYLNQSLFLICFHKMTDYSTEASDTKIHMLITLYYATLTHNYRIMVIYMPIPGQSSPPAADGLQPVTYWHTVGP